MAAYCGINALLIATECPEQVDWVLRHNMTVNATTVGSRCMEETYWVTIDLVVGVLWFVTAVLVFCIPRQPAMWGNDEEDPEKEEEDHVELETVRPEHPVLGHA